jgi:hypothetical protein
MNLPGRLTGTRTAAQEGAGVRSKESVNRGPIFIAPRHA